MAEVNNDKSVSLSDKCDRRLSDPANELANLNAEEYSIKPDTYDSASLDDVFSDECASPSSCKGENFTHGEDSSPDNDCSDLDSSTDESSGEDSLENDDIEQFVDAGEDVEGDANGQQPWISERRHSGDGEEQPDEMAEAKKIDDDLDRENPAYVPRKGAFFEHDLRLDDDDAENDVINKQKDSKNTSKKLWIESKKWKHDRFDERSQGPKSREEIVAAYGFDIRSAEDGDAQIQGKVCPSKKTRTSRRNQANKLSDFIKAPPLDLPSVVDFEVKESSSQNKISNQQGAPSPGFIVPTITATSNELGRKESSLSMPSNQTSHDDGKAGRKPRGWKQNERNTLRATAMGSERTVAKLDDDSSTRPITTRSLGPGPKKTRATESRRSKHKSEHMPHPADFSSSHSQLARTIVISDRRPRMLNSSAKSSAISDVSTTTTNNGNTVSITVTQSQDVRRCLPDLQAAMAVAGSDRRADRKSTVIVRNSMAPEIIPPITNVATYTRSTKLAKARSNSSMTVVASDGGATASSRGWTGGEFIPAASRSYVSQQQQPISLQSSAGSRSKRYSSQRQRNPGEGGNSSGGNHEPRVLPASPASVAHSSHLVSVAPVLPLQARPLTPAFFSNPHYQVTSGPLPIFAHGPVAPGVRVPQLVGSQHIMHPPFVARAGSVPMLPPTSFIGQPAAVVGCGPPLTSSAGQNFVSMPYPSVPLSEFGTNPLEVRGGTVYFSPDVQKALPDQLGGTIYFDPGQQVASSGTVKSPARRPKAAIPIVNPQDLKAVSQESAESLSQGRQEDHEEQQLDVEHSAEAEAQTAVMLSATTADVQSTLPIASSNVVEE